MPCFPSDDDNNNTLTGGLFDEPLVGEGGHDLLTGLGGRDNYDRGSGDDAEDRLWGTSILGGAGRDDLTGGA